MASIYEELEKALSDFQSKAAEELKTIQECKREILQLKAEMLDQLYKGQYIRDDNRIVISAPEIIIGDVNKDGTLRDTGHSVVIVRANNVSQEAVDREGGQPGTITNRASMIYNVCASPGIAGDEEVVGNNSQFIVQAKGIALTSEDAEGAFINAPSASDGEISLTAEKSVHIDAVTPTEKEKDNIQKQIDDIKTDDKKKDVETAMKELADSRKTIDETIDGYKDKYQTLEEIRTQTGEVDMLRDQLEMENKIFSSNFIEAYRRISSLAEAERRKKCLEDKKKKIGEAKDDKRVATAVTIQAENTSIMSTDADGKVFNNETAGFSVTGKHISFCGADETTTMEDSNIDMMASSINISTVCPKHEEETSDFPVTGDVHISSKNIVMESVDYEYKDEKFSEKALTEGGGIRMRAETIDVCTNDSEGAGKGKVNVNSKVIALKAVDLDKESRAEKELTKESTLSLLADKIYAGSPNKDTQTQSVQIASDKVGIFAKTTAELQQDEAKAALQLDGGNIALTGSKTTLFGETTMNGKTAFKADVESGKMTVDNIEIKSSFKSPCTSEGIAVPASPSSDSLSAKLQMEEAPKEEAEKK